MRLLVVFPVMLLMGVVWAFIGLFSTISLGTVLKKTGENFLGNRSVDQEQIKKTLMKLGQSKESAEKYIKKITEASAEEYIKKIESYKNKIK